MIACQEYNAEEVHSERIENGIFCVFSLAFYRFDSIFLSIFSQKCSKVSKNLQGNAQDGRSRSQTIDSGAGADDSAAFA